MNFLGLRSHSTAAQVPHALPPQIQPESNNRKQTATLEDIVTEDLFPLASLIESFDGRSEGIVSGNGATSAKTIADNHIDVCEDEGWITIPYKELPDSWNEEPDMQPFDRAFVFPGEQVHILACLSAYKQETEIMTPFKVAELMSKNGPKKDSESLVRMDEYKRQTEMLLQRFRNSHFFARIAEGDEPLWSRRVTRETFRESTEMIGGFARNGWSANQDAGSTSGGVARNGFTCSALANGDIVVVLTVNVGVERLRNPVLEIIQFEKLYEDSGDLLKWLLPLENSSARFSSPPARLSSGSGFGSSSSTIRTTSTKLNSNSLGSHVFSFGHFRSHSMSSVPPASSVSGTTSSLLEDYLSSNSNNNEKGENEGLMSFRGVALEPERFSTRCGLQGVYIPGRRWRRKVEIIQPVEITSFTSDCNTQDLLCVQIKNVSPAHVPEDIIIYLDTITIIHEEASNPLSLPVACIEAGDHHSLPDLALRIGEEHSFILKPATSLLNKGQSVNCVTFGDKYAVLVSCRCNYTESRLFFKQPTSWRPRMPRDLLISVESQMSRLAPLGSDDKRIPAQLPVQVLTLEASNLTHEDLTLTVLAPASSSLPSVVSLNSTPAGSPVHDGDQTGSFNFITDVLRTGCTHLWLQSRVPLGCVPCRSTVTVKLEVLPLTDGVINLDSLQISVKEKGLIYVPEKSLKINATSSISSGNI